MSELDSLNSLNFAAQNHISNQTLKNKKTEEASKTKKSKFSDLLKRTSEPEPSFDTKGLPAEIETMSIEEAAIYLKESVDTAGNALAEEVNAENLEKFKQSVRNFIVFVSKNNFEVETKLSINRRTKKPVMVSPSPFFSSYQLPPHTVKKTSIVVINQKLDELTQETLSMQSSNLQILEKINGIKGLIVDLISS